MKGCVSRAWLGLVKGQEGRTGARSCVRFPGTYPAPLVFPTDLYLYLPLWHTPLCAEGAEVRKGGADKGNADSRLVVHPHPGPHLLPTPIAPHLHLKLRATDPISNSAADHEQTICSLPASS